MNSNSKDGKIKKGMRFSPATEFKKDHIPWNVRNREEYLKRIRETGGLERMKPTQFKKGDRPHSWKPVGTISFRNHRNKVGYKYIKIAEPNIWIQLHVYIWQRAHGKVPAHHCLRFKNSDQKDCRLENLELITRAKNARLNADYESDKYIASTMARKKGIYGFLYKELRDSLLKQPEMLDLKRKQLMLRRAINDRARNRS